MPGTSDRDRRFPQHAAVVGIAGMAFAAFWAAGAVFQLSGPSEGCATVQGARILWAVVVVLGGCALGTVIVLAASVLERYGLLAAGLLVGVGALGTALLLLALDSATYLERVEAGSAADCDLEPIRFGLLYALWAIPLALIAVEAFYVLASSRRRAG